MSTDPAALSHVQWQERAGSLDIETRCFIGGAFVDAGVVWVNCFAHGDMTSPWGGYKQSGFGRDKRFESMLQHTRTKSVWVHLGD